MAKIKGKSISREQILKMVKIINGRQEGDFLSGKEYYKGKGILAKIIMPITKRLRAYHAERYIEARESHLDIGCGDGYFMKRSKCREVFGLDMKYGDLVKDKLDFPDNHFDYITMLAVIEHLENPDVIFNEVHRVLKKEGMFILTTPTRKGEKLIHLYCKNIEEEHVEYYDLDSIRKLSSGLFQIIDYKTFIFGRNQLFCLVKM